MRKIVVCFLTVVMLLSLTGCGETAKHAKLYEKYVDVITELENQEYKQAIATVAGMAAEAQAEERLAKEHPGVDVNLLMLQRKYGRERDF